MPEITRSIRIVALDLLKRMRAAQNHELRKNRYLRAIFKNYKTRNRKKRRKLGAVRINLDMLYKVWRAPIKNAARAEKERSATIMVVKNPF